MSDYDYDEYDDDDGTIELDEDTWELLETAIRVRDEMSESEALIEEVAEGVLALQAELGRELSHGELEQLAGAVETYDSTDVYELYGSVIGQPDLRDDEQRADLLADYLENGIPGQDGD